MASDDPQSSLIERLVAECLDRRLRFHAALLEDVCREHPELAPRLREALSNGGRAQQHEADGQSDGQHLGSYRILNELGRGGQAVVYLAEDTRLRRQVALKVLKGFGPLSEKVIERFRREAEVTSKLDHPGICTVYDTGVENGIPFIAMRLVHGTTLAARIAAAAEGDEFVVDAIEAAPSRRETAPRSSHATTHAEIDAIVEIIEKTARALHVAHEAGVIHRDIKPGNVIVTEDGQPVVLDFGLASDEDGDYRTLTQSGDLFGTPAYMSPEQLMAQRVRLDRRTDVYSLGVTLFECLALRQPFEAPTREATYQAIQHKQPPDIRKMNLRVSRDLQVVIETALEKNRDKRYATAQAFAEDLRRVRASEPIAAKPVGTIGRVVRYAKRRPAMAALIGVLVLAVPIIAGLGGFLAANWDEIEIQKQRAVDDEVERHLQDGYLELADGSPERAIVEFDAALAVRAGLPEAIAGKAMALVRANRRDAAVGLLDAHPALLASEPGFGVLRSDALRKAPDRAAVSSPGTAVTTPLGLFLVGQRELNRGDAVDGADPDAYRRAVVSLRDAVSRARVARLLFHGSLVRAAGRAHDRDLVRTLVPALLSLWPDSGWAEVQAGVALAQTGESDAALSAFQRAIRLNPNLATAHSNLGTALKERGEIDEAIAEQRKAIELDPETSTFHNNLGVALSDRGEVDAAIAAYRRAIELEPERAMAHNNLGVSLKEKGKIDEAIAEYRRAIEIEPRFAPAYLNLGVELGGKGEIDEAIAAHRKAIEIDPTNALAHTNLGGDLTKKGLREEAIAAHRKAVELDPRSSLAHNNLGRELRQLGQVDAAIAELRTAIALDPKSSEARVNLGPELGAKGQVDEAVAVLREAVQLAPKSSMAHNNLAVQLSAKGDVDEAIAEYRKAIALDPKNALAHNGLAVRFVTTGRINDALAEWRTACEVDPSYTIARDNLRAAQGLEAFERSLDAVLSGGDWPEDPVELVEVALVASGRDLHALAARIWTRAFAEQPALTEVPNAWWRERAARSAVIAASGAGKDGAALDASATVALRTSASGWFTQELALRSRIAAARGGMPRNELRWTLERWKTDPKLVSVRESVALARLDASERQAWTKLWQDVDAKLAELSK